MSLLRRRDETPELDEQIDIRGVGLWLALAGAAAAIIAVFLPRVEATDYSRVVDNTLIQSGDGWWIVILVVLDVAVLYRAYVGKKRTWGPVITGGLLIASAIYAGTAHSSLQICSVDPATFGQNCEMASPSVGIYLVGIAGLLMVVGGWQIRTSPRTTAAAAGETDNARPTKTCPECAETVLAAAKVCKHCGFRFDAAPEAGAAQTSP